MKLILLIFPFLLLSCSSGNNKETAENRSADTMAAPNINPTPEANTEHFGNYAVTVVAKKEGVGDSIGVLNTVTKQSFRIEEDAAYFKTVIDSFMVLDVGTAVYRNLEIYNLNSKQVVFTSGYQGELEIKEKTVGFKTRVENEDKNLMPKCPSTGEYNGYLESQSFNLADLKLSKSGKYECAYFE